VGITVGEAFGSFVAVAVGAAAVAVGTTAVAVGAEDGTLVLRSIVLAAGAGTATAI
jgi:hypothetical protein